MCPFGGGSGLEVNPGNYRLWLESDDKTKELHEGGTKPVER